MNHQAIVSIADTIARSVHLAPRCPARRRRRRHLVALAGLVTASGACAPAATPAASQAPVPLAATDVAPLAIGETFTLPSRVLGEVRRINVYRPPAYGEPAGAPRPVLYMPDGGIAEDFLHVAGLLQVSVGNGTMRPFLLVGIENTERRRDTTGPTATESDRKIAPRVGGSAKFREFIRTELMPAVRARYATTGERAVVGESLAGLFVVETFLLEPTLFDTYIAFDPSLWWDDRRLVREAAARIGAHTAEPKALYLASSNEPGIVRDTGEFAAILAAGKFPGLAWQYHPMPQETHGTIYHPAALDAFRRLLAPAAAK